MSEFVSKSCQGELCFCGRDASHKVEETIFHDDPQPERHSRTAYVCDQCFGRIMGPTGYAQSTIDLGDRLIAFGKALQNPDTKLRDLVGAAYDCGLMYLFKFEPDPERSIDVPLEFPQEEEG